MITARVKPPRSGLPKALARLGLVAAIHVALLFVLVQQKPEIRKQLEPVLVRLIAPPRVDSEPLAPPPPKPKPKPAAKAVPKPQLAAPPPPATPEPSPGAITIEPSPPVVPSPAPPQPPAPLAAEAPPAAPIAPVVAPPPAAPIVPPRFDAAYLKNPPPEYPRVSRRMGEHGKVMLRVYVSALGTAEKVEIRNSSGSHRLDQAAREAVERWKFVPARQGDEPVGAWVIVPISFVLEG